MRSKQRCTIDLRALVTHQQAAEIRLPRHRAKTSQPVRVEIFADDFIRFGAKQIRADLPLRALDAGTVERLARQALQAACPGAGQRIDPHRDSGPHAAPDVRFDQVADSIGRCIPGHGERAQVELHRFRFDDTR